MTAFDKRLVLAAVVFTLLSIAGVALLNLRAAAKRMADYSAHAALAVEIEHRLAAVSEGQPYPDSLSELRLTYPDGGNSSLLRRFTYQSTGSNCAVRTVLHDREIVLHFPR